MEVTLAGCFVEDLETAKKFYMEKLGLSVMFESQGFCEDRRRHYPFSFVLSC
jgi:catechol-2,3-dioxygenase